MAQVGDEVERLVADGYYVVARSERLVELERKNSRFSVIIHAVLAGGGHTAFRTSRIYIQIDKTGEATLSLHPSHEED
ncbi:MAG: hypothetical protein DK306_001972 [Chloroflexi bacterium]|jgi:hypothetical protein|nr:MAG: hypothetical protein DK306_001972 [Chloroflexota bacterium]